MEFVTKIVSWICLSVCLSLSELSLPPAYARFFFGLLIGCNNGSNIFLRNVGLSLNYTPLQQRRPYTSKSSLWEPQIDLGGFPCVSSSFYRCNWIHISRFLLCVHMRRIGGFSIQKAHIFQETGCTDIHIFLAFKLHYGASLCHNI
jgi:hypothetical protein